MSNGRNVRRSSRPVGPNNINGGPSTNSLNPQQQLWKVLQFHETRLNNLEQMIDVILRALPWEARLEATDVEKYRKVENKLEGIEKEIENLKEESVTSEVFNDVERNVERNVERVSIIEESPEDYLRREELLEGVSMKSVMKRNNKKGGGRRVSLEVHE